MSESRGLVPRFLSLASGKVLSTVVAVLATPVIVRLLGPGGYGDYAVLLSIFSLYMIPISSAVTEGVQKFVAEDRPGDHWRERVIQFYGLLGLGLVAAGALLLLALTWIGVPRRVFGPAFTLYFYLLVALVVVGQCRAIALRTLLGFGLEHVKGPLDVAKKLTTVLVGIGLVLAGLGVEGMLIGHVASSLLVAAIAGAVIARRISLPALVRWPRTVPAREFLSFNAMNIVLVLLVMSLFHVDVIMVRTFLDSEATGFYKAALALAEYLWIVPIVLQSLLLHSSSSLWSDGRIDHITTLAGRVTRYTTLLVMLMAIGLATLADRFVPLYYGPEFVVATVPLLLLLPGAVGFAVARPLQAICQGSGELRPLVLATGLAATLNVVLNAILIPLFGMNGAAVATSTGYGSMFLLLVWAARRIGYDPLDDFRPGRIAATVVLSAVVIVAVDRLFQEDLLALAVVPVVGFVAFVAIAIRVGALDVEEVADILDRVPGPIGGASRSRG